MPKRAFLIVLDACGIGSMPDWKEYDDPPNTNTLKNVIDYADKLHLPNLQSLGLGNIESIKNLPPVESPKASFGKALEASIGKDTTTGHWEMAGLIVERPFPVYPNGFPPEIIEKFINQTNCGGILGNEPASGTEILVRLGERHLETRFPIIYTSADSVFQIASNVSKISLETLYSFCEIAREILHDQHEVSRVIARPFTGESSKDFKRLSEHRHDYAIKPRGRTILDFLSANNCKTISVGKINDIFCGVGLDEVIEGKSNEVCLQNITNLIKQKNNKQNQFIFANLVETDSHFGHRNDVIGFGEALEKIDIEIGKWIELMDKDDLLILTADHGCDPTTKGTDHTREYIPILAYSPSLQAKNIGIRKTFADTTASISQWFNLDSQWGIAESYI